MSSTISPDESQHESDLAEPLEVGDHLADSGAVRNRSEPGESGQPCCGQLDAGDEPCCPKCLMKGQDTSRAWCRRCGYYGKLGTYIDLDPEEREYTPSELAALASESARPLWKQIPGWGWQLAALVLAVLAAGVAARLLTPPESVTRLLLTVAGLVLGLLAFFAAHFAAYVVAAMDDSHLTLIDMVLRPMAVWAPTVRKLPAGRWRILTAAGGLAAVFSALVVVDGIPFERIWGEPQQQPKRNVVKQDDGVADEAIESVDDASDPGPEMLENPFDKEPPIARPHEVQCLIAGYVPDANDSAHFQSLVLVANIRGQLQYVGDVSEGIHEQVRRELNRQLPALVVAAPPVPSTRQDVRWLQARLTCQVKFADWTNDDQLEHPLFEQLLEPAATRPSSAPAETP